MQRFRVPLRRFSVEKFDGDRWVVVDWAYGLLHPAGRGHRGEQEVALLWIKEYCRRHGDVNVLRLPKRMGKPPDWGFCRPAERPGWREERRRIARAFARIGEVIRERGIPDEALSKDPELLLAKRNAERIWAEARKSVGLS